MIRRLGRAPLTHFALLGALLWWSWHPAPESTAPASDATLLLHSARAFGLDHTDAAIRHRLATLGGFVGEDASDRTALIDLARRLHLDRSDLIVQRHLTQMMELAAAQVPPAEYPTDAELTRWLSAHAAEFTVPARMRFTHVYLSRAAHGARLTSDAATILTTLQREHVSPQDADLPGEPFLSGREQGPLTRAAIERSFGSAFADALERAPLAAWFGPVASPFGLHVIWVSERRAAEMPSLTAVRGRVVHGWLHERGLQHAAERLTALRAH